jgi:hypothetical protein
MKRPGHKGCHPIKTGGFPTQVHQPTGEEVPRTISQASVDHITAFEAEREATRPTPVEAVVEAASIQEQFEAEIRSIRAYKEDLQAELDRYNRSAVLHAENEAKAHALWLLATKSAAALAEELAQLNGEL